LKEAAKERRTLSHDTYKTTLYCKKEPVLTVYTDIFQFAGRSLTGATRRINAHYLYLAKRMKRRGQRTLYRRALAARKSAGPAGFIPHTLSVKHKVTYNDRDLLSLYHDHAENDGQAREAVCRTADTWRLSEGVPVTLGDVCGGRKALRRLLRLAVTEAGQHRENGQAPYSGRYARAMRRHFDRSRFYLTDRGVALFWEAGGIAPAAKGLQVIVVPYEALGMK
jgi:hypothetical protein